MHLLYFLRKHLENFAADNTVVRIILLPENDVMTICPLHGLGCRDSYLPYSGRVFVSSPRQRTVCTLSLSKLAGCAHCVEK
jgi:hypothetical protein